MTSLEKTNSEIQEIDLKLEQTKAGEKRDRSHESDFELAQHENV